jgi:hypothetical protein
VAVRRESEQKGDKSILHRDLKYYQSL